MKPPAGAEDWPCRHEDALAFQTTQVETGTLHPVQLPCEGTHAPQPHRHTSTHAASEQRLSACCPDQGSCRRRDPELPQEPTARLTARKFRGDKLSVAKASTGNGRIGWHQPLESHLHGAGIKSLLEGPEIQLVGLQTAD